jgi:hypothetical protein
MLITISWPRFAQLLRELENQPDATDDELEVRLPTFARKAFDECAAQFGIRVGNLAAPATKSVAEFQADISGCRDHEATFGVDWVRLLEGLRWLRVIAVSITQDDWAVFCDRLYANAMQDAHYSIAHELANIGIDEIHSHVEQWCQHVCLKMPEGGNGTVTESEALLKELYIRSALGNAGLRDPLAKHNAIEEHRQAEEAAYKKAEAGRADDFYRQFTR